MSGSARRHATLVAAGILASRVTGLARERAVAHFLGRSLALDAFRAALRIPNTLQNLLGEGVLSASFVPVYARLLAQGRAEEAGRVAGAVAGLLCAVTGALVLVGVLAARPITAVVAAGFTGQAFELTVTLVRILFPGIGLLVLSAWALGVLNSHRRFFLSYVAPVLWNVAQIGALVGVALLVLPDSAADPVTLERLAVALALGATAGGALQLAIQLPAVLRLAHGLRLSLAVRNPGVRQTIAAFGPVVTGRGVVQLSALVDQFIASFLVAGAVGSLGYAQILAILPVSLFGMSVAAAALPAVAGIADDADPAVLRRSTDDGLRTIAFYVVPSAVAYLVIGDLLVAALFQTGRFDRLDTLVVWLLLAGYAAGLVASASSRLYQSVLYGLGDPRSPARAAIVRVVLAAALGALLAFPLDRVAVTLDGLVGLGAATATGWFGPLPADVRGVTTGGARLGALGLALAASAGAWVELGLLRTAVHRSVGRVRLGGGALPRTAAAAAVAGGAGLLLRPLVVGLPPLLAGPLAAAVFGVAYLAAGRALGLGEARALLRGRRTDAG